MQHDSQHLFRQLIKIGSFVDQTEVGKGIGIFFRCILNHQTLVDVLFDEKTIKGEKWIREVSERIQKASKRCSCGKMPVTARVSL